MRTVVCAAHPKSTREHHNIEAGSGSSQFPVAGLVMTRINERGALVGPHRVEISLPVQFLSQAPELLLFAQTQQRLQAQLDGFAFGFQAGCPKRIPHQLVVNDDVRPHASHPSHRTSN